MNPVGEGRNQFERGLLNQPPPWKACTQCFASTTFLQCMQGESGGLNCLRVDCLQNHVSCMHVLFRRRACVSTACVRGARLSVCSCRV
jgi:hypothetical protein